MKRIGSPLDPFSSDHQYDAGYDAALEEVSGELDLLHETDGISRAIQVIRKIQEARSE